jgi:hypothetical protein
MKLVPSACLILLACTSIASSAAAYAAEPVIDPDAVIVAPNGDDNNPGTLDQPLATLERAQAVVRSRERGKTVYLREGLYQVTKMLRLTSADDGQTWAQHPKDPMNSAILDASDLAFSACNSSNVILIHGGSNITINGLTIRNFPRGGGITIHGGPRYPDFRAGGCFVYGKTGPARGNTISNTIIHDVGDGADNVYPWGWFAGIAAWGDAQNTVINNNAVFDVGGIGISLNVLQMGPRNGIDDSIIRNNAVLRTNRASRAGDLGAIYVIDRTGSSTGVAVKNNFVRDYGDPSRRVKGIYLDDGVSNVTVEGNVVAGSGTWAVQIHSGNRNRLVGNILDLGSDSPHWALLYQNSAGRGNMVGNSVERNLIVANFASMKELVGNVYFSGYSPNGFEHPTVQDNFYWNAVEGLRLPVEGDIRDQAPVFVDPQLVLPHYALPAGSAVYAGSAPFPRQPDDWGGPGFWGPPGYTVPAP